MPGKLLVNHALKRLTLAKKIHSRKLRNPFLKASFDEGFRDEMEKQAASPYDIGMAAALATALLGVAAARPIQKKLMDKIEKGTKLKAKKTHVFTEEDDALVAKAIKEYKKEHPELKKVKVLATADKRIPTSMSVGELPEPLRKVFKAMGIKPDTVYLKHKSPEVALHELSHSRRPTFGYRGLLSLLSGGLTGVGVGALAGARPGGTMSKLAPAFVAAAQVPTLAEEATASLQATAFMRRKKMKEEGRLLPAWGTYAVGAAVPTTAVAIGTAAKERAARQGAQGARILARFLARR